MLKSNPTVVYEKDQEYPIKILFWAFGHGEIPFLYLSIQEAKGLTSFMSSSCRITLEFDSSIGRCGFVKSDYNPGTQQYLCGIITELHTGNQVNLSRDTMWWLHHNLLSTLGEQSPRLIKEMQVSGRIDTPETFDQMCKRKRDAMFKDKGH